jgi:hypothetical protein
MGRPDRGKKSEKKNNQNLLHKNRSLLSGVNTLQLNVTLFPRLGNQIVREDDVNLCFTLGSKGFNLLDGGANPVPFRVRENRACKIDFHS